MYITLNYMAAQSLAFSFIVTLPTYQPKIRYRSAQEAARSMNTGSISQTAGDRCREMLRSARYAMQMHVSDIQIRLHNASSITIRLMPYQ